MRRALARGAAATAGITGRGATASRRTSATSSAQGGASASTTSATASRPTSASGARAARCIRPTTLAPAPWTLRSTCMNWARSGRTKTCASQAGCTARTMTQFTLPTKVPGALPGQPRAHRGPLGRLALLHTRHGIRILRQRRRRQRAPDRRHPPHQAHVPILESHRRAGPLLLADKRPRRLPPVWRSHGRHQDSPLWVHRDARQPRHDAALGAQKLWLRAPAAQRGGGASPAGRHGWLERTGNMTLDDLMAGKKRTFFFAGRVRHPDPEYSGLARQILHNLTRQWNDTEFDFVEGGVPDYEQRLRSTKFCLAAYGHGWGNRLLQAVLTGCVPVIVQDHVIHYFEDVLPFEDFSIRLNNADLPHLREILRSLTDEQYRHLLRNLLRYYKAFTWNDAMGGQAFEYTLLSLRRKYLNFKSLYYGRYSHLEQENCQSWTPEGCKPSTATS